MTEASEISADDLEEKAPPSDAQLKGVRDHAADLWKREKRVAELEAELAAERDAIAVLQEATLPAAMRDVGMAAFALTNGYAIELEKFAHGAPKKEDEPKLHAWLEDQGFGAIIKHWITITFGKDDDKFFRKFLSDLAKRKKPVQFERKDAVHSSTWKSFFKERWDLELAGGVPPEKRLPRELLSVHEGTRAVLVNHAELDAKRAATAAKAKATKAAKKAGPAAGKDEEVAM